jgi:hypothetical protein
MASVVLFKPSGKYYTTEEWRIPTEIKDHSPERGDFVRGVIGPYDMDQSPDFRRISGGPVLIESQEPWGWPHLFPTEDPTRGEKPEPVRTEWRGQLEGGPDEGNFVTVNRPRFEVEMRTQMWIDGERGHVIADELRAHGWYVWHEKSGAFRWVPSR